MNQDVRSVGEEEQIEELSRKTQITKIADSCSAKISQMFPCLCRLHCCSFHVSDERLFHDRIT